jgi:hypothetical protein
MKTKKTKEKKPKKVKSLEEIPELLKGEPILDQTEKFMEENKEMADSVLNNEPVKNGEVVPETPEEPKEEPITNVNNCEYRLTLQFNNETYDCFTNNLKIGILSFAREVLTEMFIKIEKGSAIFEKKLNLTQAKMLFNDMQSLEIFLETFYGLYGRPTSKQLM